MEYDSVFEKACLVQLSTSVWTPTRMLDHSVMETIGNSDWVRGRKFIINPELLGPINTTTHQARNLVQKHSLPFPITGLYLIPKDHLSYVDSRLEEYKKVFTEKIKAFEKEYDQARNEARLALGNLFNENDYPVSIKNKFSFNWRFLTISLPGKSTILSPEIYEKEKQKFIDMMTEAKELASYTLINELKDIIDSLVDKLNGTTKTIKGTMFNRLYEFMDNLGTKNLFNDTLIKEFTIEAKEALKGISPYGLSYNESIKKTVKDSISALKVSIDAAIEDLPKRKIRFAA
ncbi:MAG: DUF3150 domain-containing protein [Syntrophorhabdaceae bacterium]|nr:DUF3150 domain-containing protein [Syntrophorhabdaceae bacterium]